MPAIPVIAAVVIGAATAAVSANQAKQQAKEVNRLGKEQANKQQKAIDDAKAETKAAEDRAAATVARGQLRKTRILSSGNRNLFGGTILAGQSGAQASQSVGTKTLLGQ